LLVARRIVDACAVTDVPWLTSGRDAWLHDVRAWLDDVVDGRIVGMASVKEMPWGAVLAVETAGDRLYFKAAGPRGRHETRLLADLAVSAPRLIPPVLAVDHDRAWMLLGDAGTLLRDLDATAQVAIVESLLPAYAAMQRATAANVPAWIEAGVNDRGVEAVASQLEDVLRGNTRIGQLPIDGDERARYVDALPHLAAVGAELATTDVPVALDHADLHGTNVVVTGERGCIIDWGDAIVTHPFVSMFVPYQFVVRQLAPPDRLWAVLRLRDAYLEGWGGGAEDHAAFRRAVWLGHVTRAIGTAHELDAPEAQALGGIDEIIELLRAWHARRNDLDDDISLVPTAPGGHW
jgi:hypothetical protein